MPDAELAIERVLSRTEPGPEPTSVLRSIRAVRPGLAFSAAKWSVLCFAAMHLGVLTVHFLQHHDPNVFNVFSILEAQRLWPRLVLAPAAPWWSYALVLLVYGTVYGLLSRASRRATTVEAARRPGPAASVDVGVGTAALDVAVATSPARVRWRATPGSGVAFLVGGLAVHMGALALVERFVRDFPGVPDVLHSHLPYVAFGVPGELVYATFLVLITIVLARDPARVLPNALTLLGLFYAVRGVFLFVMPLGMPPTAAPLSSRFVLYPFAGHAYFPGGHTGMMTILSLSVSNRAWRRAFLVTTAAFAFGTLLARTHYTGDALGGWLVGYAIVLWGRSHLAGPDTPAEARRAWTGALRIVTRKEA